MTCTKLVQKRTNLVRKEATKSSTNKKRSTIGVESKFKKLKLFRNILKKNKMFFI